MSYLHGAAITRFHNKETVAKEKKELIIVTWNLGYIPQKGKDYKSNSTYWRLCSLQLAESDMSVREEYLKRRLCRKEAGCFDRL